MKEQYELLQEEEYEDELCWLADFLNRRGSRYHAREWLISSGCVVHMNDEESY